MCVHLDSVCAANAVAALSTIRSFAYVVDHYPAEVTRAFLMGVLQVLPNTRPITVLQALFPQSTNVRRSTFAEVFTSFYTREMKLLCLSDDGTLAPFYSTLTRPNELVIFETSNTFSEFLPASRYYLTDPLRCSMWHQAAIKLVIQRTGLIFASHGDTFPRYLKGEKMKVTDLFRQEPGFWCIFLAWTFVTSRSFIATHLNAMYTSSVLTKSHEKLFEMVVSCFGQLVISVEDESTQIGPLADCELAPRECFEVAMSAFSLPKIPQSVTAMSQRAAHSLNILHRLEPIIGKFFQDDLCRVTVSSLIEKWKLLRIRDLSFFFESKESQGETMIPYLGKMSPIPRILLRSEEWMKTVYGSPLFMKVWKSVVGPNTIDKLLKVRVVWESLMEDVGRRTISFEQLESIIDHLKALDELKLLYSTTQYKPSKSDYTNSPVVAVTPSDSSHADTPQDVNPVNMNPDEEAGKEGAVSHKQEKEEILPSKDDGKKVDDSKQDGAPPAQSAKAKTSNLKESVMWDIREPKEEFLMILSYEIEKFWHVHCVYRNMDDIQNCLPLFRPWIRDQESIDQMLSDISILRSTLSKVKWENLLFKNMEELYVSCKLVPSPLFDHTPALFQKALDCRDVFDWLRSQADDQDFQRGIELAMGKSEMECPVELWVEGVDGTPGHPNEQTLSMLQTVRTFFHKLIYRNHEVYADFWEFVNEFLSCIPHTDEETLISQMDHCIRLYLPLMDLLNTSGESAAPDRLLRLCAPASDARWICRTVPKDNINIPFSTDKESSSLHLEYFVQEKKSSILKKLTLSEIEDFQSSVVLAQTDHRGEDTQAKVHNFLHGFGWMKSFRVVVGELVIAGHFDFVDFSQSFSLTDSFEVIREKTLELKRSLSAWEDTVSAVRLKYPLLNQFGMPTIFEGFRLLQSYSDTPTVTFEMLRYVQSVLYVLNPLHSWQNLSPQTEWNRLVSIWRGSGKAVESLQFAEKLDLMGHIFQSAYVDIPPPLRSVESSISKEFSFKKGGVFVITTASDDALFEQTLAVYASINVLPERRNLFFCRSHTTWMEIYIFLLRWRAKCDAFELKDSSHDIFCLTHADILSVDVQMKIVEFLQRFPLVSNFPLVFVCGTSRGAHIVTHFSTRYSIYHGHSSIRMYLKRFFII